MTLTPTEQRLYDAMGDGEAHSVEELLLILDEDGLAAASALYKHIYRMKLKLRSTGEELISQNLGGGRFGYRRMYHILQATAGT